MINKVAQVIAVLRNAFKLKIIYPSIFFELILMTLNLGVWPVLPRRRKYLPGLEPATSPSPAASQVN